MFPSRNMRPNARAVGFSLLILSTEVKRGKKQRHVDPNSHEYEVGFLRNLKNKQLIEFNEQKLT